MSLNLAAAIAQAKNLLSDPGAWLVLLEINTPALDESLKLVRNTEDIDWNGNTWTAFPFELDEAKQSSDGTIQSVSIRVSNVLRQVEGYINEADGGVGSVITIRVVYSEELGLTDPILEEPFKVGKVMCTNDWVSFELQPDSFFTQLFPRCLFARISCNKKFKGRRCGYTGTVFTTCNQVMEDCIERGNISRFGGCPAIPNGSFDEAGITPSYAE